MKIKKTGYPSLCVFIRTLLHKMVSSDKTVAISAVFLSLIVLLCVLVPILSPYDHYSHNLDGTFLPPLSEGHIFGTDEFGRDLFVRVWEGARISLFIGFFAAVILTIIGVLYGGISGILGGIADELMMRFVDVVYSIPNLIVVILITLMLGSNAFTIIFALSVTEWIGAARVVRGQTLLLREMEFVQAARVLGAGRIHILLKHVLPNSAGPVMVNLMQSIPGAIFAESFLSFLGMGVKLPKASWGTLASDGYRYINTYPWLLLIPICFIGLTMIALNILGDAAKNLLETRHDSIYIAEETVNKAVIPAAADRGKIPSEKSVGKRTF